MAIEDMEVPYLPYGDMAKKADDFLAEHHPDDTVPIPIESIVELRLKIDLCPKNLLLEIAGTDAFINSQLDVIYVDHKVYVHPNHNRYRFSLAHELSHRILHVDLIRSIEFSTIDGWREAHARLPEKARSRMEFQGYALGGLLLVPSRHFRKRYSIAARELVDCDLDDPKLDDFARDEIHARLAEEFQVSCEVIDRRYKYGKGQI